jgi:cobalamin biosynthesis protein CobT
MKGTGKFVDEINDAVAQQFEDSPSDYVAMTTEYDEFVFAPTLSQSIDFGESASEYLGKKAINEYALNKENDMVNMLHQDAVVDVGAASKQLEKAFASQNRSYYEPGKRSGRVNPSSLFKLKTGDDRVFRKKVDIKALNTSVSLVIDQSGSMCSKEKLRKASIAAYALAEVLTRMKIPFEIIGFTTGGYGEDGITRAEADKARHKFHEQTGRTYFSREGKILWNVYKSFNERFEYEQKCRMAAAYDHSVAMRSNADAESIQLCAKRLGERDEPRKCMIVLSDGQPACAGDSNDQNTQLVKVVKNIQKAGIDIVGLGVCSNAVESYYDKHIVFHDSSEIASRVIGELSRMLLPTNK